MSRLLQQDETGKIKVTKEGLVLPEIKAMKDADHTAGKKTFAELVKYVYFVHDKESVYADLTINTRKNVVWKDQFDDYSEEQFKNLASKSEVRLLANKLNLLQYSPAERHLKVCEDKFEQFEQLYLTTEVGHENFDKIAAQLRGSQSLYEVLDKLREKVHKEIKEQSEGNYTPALFEDD